MPRHGLALQGRDKPLETLEATFRGGQRWVISPLQGLLPEHEGVWFATQAVGLGLCARKRNRPERWKSSPSQRNLKPTATASPQGGVGSSRR
jgi:hypothetical protein